LPQRRRREATVIESNSPKVHSREDNLATVHIRQYTCTFLL
jgi:hypothetical protein